MPTSIQQWTLVLKSLAFARLWRTQTRFACTNVSPHGQHSVEATSQRLRVILLVLSVLALARAVNAQPQPTYFKASAFASVTLGAVGRDYPDNEDLNPTATARAELVQGPALPDVPTLAIVSAGAGAGAFPAFEQFPGPRLDRFGLHAAVYRFVNNDPGSRDLNVNLNAQATAIAEWIDTFVITSEVYPPGTPVQVRLGVTASGVTFADCATRVSKTFNGYLTVGQGTRRTQAYCGQANTWGDEFVEARVGEIVRLRAHLTAVVSATGPAGLTGEDWVDASRSLYFTIDPTDPNVSYRTASGRTYFTPPETPSTTAVTSFLKPNGHLIDRFLINLRSQGTVPVVLLTTSMPAFDAMAVDASSITIGDPRQTAGAHPATISYDDIDDDGDTDLILHFSIPQLVASGGVTHETATLRIAGQLRTGALFRGADHVGIVK